MRSLSALTLQVAAILSISLGLGWFLFGWWNGRFGHATLALRIGEVFVPLGVASLCYMTFAFALRLPVAKEILTMFTRRMNRN